jgi:hypothetical protein
MEQKTLNAILKKLPSLGYDASQLIYPIQDEKD